MSSADIPIAYSAGEIRRSMCTRCNFSKSAKDPHPFCPDCVEGETCSPLRRCDWCLPLDEKAFKAYLDVIRKRGTQQDRLVRSYVTVPEENQSPGAGMISDAERQISDFDKSVVGAYLRDQVLRRTAHLESREFRRCPAHV
ncbi:hypothetical protein SNE40_001624 [Patella caerulea]|uniref:Uncharacterized protein n=1 Tax=Patella caerulea TaxID=87958 RepID=A0AAN8QBC9_PATCE